MSTGSPRLPDFLLADLYRSSLVLVEEENAVPVPQPVATPPVDPPTAPPLPPVTVKPVKPAARPAMMEKTEPPALTGDWYLGNNLKKITIVVHETEAKYLKDDSFQFLSTILGACKLNMGDVAIVNHANTPLTYTQLKEKLSPACLLLFDIKAQQVQLSFTVPFYQVQKYDSCQFLLAPSLEKMLGDGQDAKLEKSKLWLCLKKMFGI